MPMRETANEIQSTLAAFIGYLRRKNMSDRTISAYTSDVNSFLRQNAKDTGSAKLSSIMAIQTKDVEDYLLGLAKSGLNFPSVRRASFALKNFFLFLVQQGSIQQNPLSTLTVHPVRGALLSYDQIVAIYHYLNRRQHSGEESDVLRYLRDELIVSLMLFYDVPQYRLCTLQLSSLRTTNKSVSLIISTKSTIQLHLAMLRKLRAYLERRKTVSDFVFLENFSDQPIHRMTIRHTLNELGSTLGIDCTHKTLRDTCAHLQQHPEARETLIQKVLTVGQTHNYAGSPNA